MVFHLSNTYYIEKICLKYVVNLKEMEIYKESLNKLYNFYIRLRMV